MRTIHFLWSTLLITGCSPPAVTSRVESQSIAHTTTPPISSCDRINKHPRAGTHGFRKCTWTEDGAVGVTAEPGSTTFRIVFEPWVGALVTSDPLELANADAEDVLVLPPPPGKTIPLTFARYHDHIQPALLGEPLPVQTCRFFAAVFDSADRLPSCVWTGLEEVEPKRYRLSFRLPDLRWKEAVAYGGSIERSLRGVEVEVLLDEQYQVGGDVDLATAVVETCQREVPTLDWAKPGQLWAAAQCRRVLGEPVAAVLKQVETRCGVLARQALPSIEASSNLRGRERDGLTVERRDAALMGEKLASVEPPSACFSENPLWNVDYTGRMAPFKLPKVVLESAWKEGLDAISRQPR